MKLTWHRIAAVLFVALLANSAYLAGFAEPTIFYMGNVLAHVVIGVLLTVAGLVLFARDRVLRREFAPAAIVLALGFAVGAYLAVAGNTRDHRPALVAHIAIGTLGALAIGGYVWRRAARLQGDWHRMRIAMVLAVVLLGAVPAAMTMVDRYRPDPRARIVNPTVPPMSMHEEGGGPQSPFFPSSAKTNVGGIIPSNFFMDSKACGECHRDIYDQWNSSVHHFASFNNQFYRKSIEYMQDVVGTQPSKWCAGCHDHAVFFNGRFDRPIKEQIDTPEARAGLACTSCHSIVHVDSTMGNGGFTIEYPPLHELATSRNPVMRALDRFLTYADPEPHRKSFMKAFMREDASEFCSTCHKVHLDVPVNQYRWFRGFNDYDSWQASGVSGQGARSFYYPPKSQTCVDCHMPLTPSKDPGNHSGQVHSHRFAAANMAVAHVNQDEAQMNAVKANLTSGFITVDIFALSPVQEQEGETRMVRRAGEGPQLMSSFAVGEEAQQGGQVFIRDVGAIAAPIEKSGVHFTPGGVARVDVVVRTRKIGHFFPGGTVDAFDVWLELQGRDADGRIIYWSGSIDEGGKGAVEPGAHFYKSNILDAEGNPINKRNAWQARSVLYVRLIPPGAADTAHFRVRVPKDARGPITLTAKLNYRKFTRYYTEFSYAGQPKPGQDPSLVGAGHNSLEYSFDSANVPKNVSGNIKGRIPDLPVIVVASDEVQVPVSSAPVTWTPLAGKADRERWNDWGIGLLLQGDLKGAEYAFTQVTKAEPGYADGWLNVARALIQEGEVEAAKPFIAQALKIDSSLGRIHFFKAMIEKADGDYDAALASLRIVESKYPRDRVVLNQMGRLLFLKREYAEAVTMLERVCRIDPEDVQAHYTMMLAYRGLGDAARSSRSEKLFMRFKAEEAAQAITGSRRRASPEDNNERQMIHEHDTAPLRSTVQPRRSTGGK